MPDASDVLSREINALLDRLGVVRAIVVVADPDSNDFIRHRRGGSIWAVGAARYIEALATRDLIEGDERVTIEPDDDEPWKAT